MQSIFITMYGNRPSQKLPSKLLKKITRTPSITIRPKRNFLSIWYLHYHNMVIGGSYHRVFKFLDPRKMTIMVYNAIAFPNGIITTIW